MEGSTDLDQPHLQMLTQTRRFIPIRVKDIGPWYAILSFVIKIAVLTNALVIAFTTTFVDKLVYSAFYEVRLSFVCSIDGDRSKESPEGVSLSPSPLAAFST